MRAANHHDGLNRALARSNFSKTLAVIVTAVSIFASTSILAQVSNVQAQYPDSSAGGWSNPSNVIGPPDDSCSNMGAVGVVNNTYNYGFNIPNGATITGFTAHTKTGEQSTQMVQIALARDADVEPPTDVGTPRILNVPDVGNGACASTIDEPLGGTPTDWGLPAITPAQINAAGFGVVYEKINTSSVKIDSICLEVFYSTASGPAVQTGCFTVPFTVFKDFTDDSMASVDVTLSCTNGATVFANPLPASEAAPAVFGVEDPSGTATCTATEAVPMGYSGDDSDCQQGNLPADGGSCTIVNTALAPSMTATKTVTNMGPFGVGNTIDYTIEVTNDGAVTLTNVVVSDPLLGLVNVLCSASLAPMASCQVMGSYMVTQADIDNNGGGDGDIDNIAEINSNEVPQEFATAEAQLVAQDPSMAVTKMVDNTGGGAGGSFQAGDTIMYTIEVTNDGNTTLTNVLVSDPLLGLTDVVCSASLAPGDSCQVMGSYLVTQADIDNNGGGDGDIDNTADVDSDQTGTQQAMAAAELEGQNPSMMVSKTVDNTGGGAGGTFQAGDTIMYTVEVTNNGNVTLTNVVVSDPLLGLTNEPCAASLAPGESCQVMGSYMVTQADIDDNGGGDGDIDNTAEGDSDEAGPQQAMAAAELEGQNPSMMMTKTVDNTGGGAGGTFQAGDTIMYTVEVTNNGNTTLTNVVVSDPLLGLTDEPCAASLAPGDSCQVMGSYLVTQADIDNNGGGDGDIDNTATGDSDQAGPEQASAEAPLEGVSAMSVTKMVTNMGTGPGGVFQAGDTIMYTIEVTNDGGVTLDNVVVSDPLLGLVNVVCSASLAPAASCQVMGSYMVTQADIDNNGGGDGDIDNTATANSDQAGPEQASAEAQLVAPDPSMMVTKTVDNTGGGAGGTFQAGDTIMYTIEVTNNGNTTLTNVVVNDPLLGLADVVCSASLAPGDSCQVMGSYMVTQGDIDDNGGGDGDIDNTATADSDQAGPEQAMAAAPLEGPVPAMSMTKTITNSGSGPGGTFDVGDTIMYTMEVSNDGNVDLTNVLVSDPLLGLTDVVCSALLIPGDSCQVMGSYMVTQGDIDDNGGGDGDIDNTATANSDQAGPQQASAAAPLVVAGPDISLDKSANPTTYSMAGDVITYSFLVTNTGNVSLFDIVVSDPLIEDPPNSQMIICPSGNPIPSLAPAASETCTGMYTVTQDDVLAGEITNLATVTADCAIIGRGEPCTSDDDSEVTEGEGFRTTFRVTKDFSDDNPLGVVVTLNCNTGLPLTQQGVVHDPDAAGLEPGDFTVIEFVVNDFLPGTMNCELEEEIPAGYVPTYTAGATTGIADAIFSDEEACYYELIEGGQFTCDIFNDLQPVDVIVEKEWIDEHPEYQLPTIVEIGLECDAEIIGGFPCLLFGNEGNGGGNYCAEQYIDPNNPGVFEVYPHFSGTECTATEELIDGVLTDESDCESMIIFPGQGDGCVIVNTRLFAGIPTLSQYGLILLALMMLGMGAVAYRRFI